MQRSPVKMFSSAAKIVFVITLAGGFLPGCAPIKEAGRPFGHTTGDVTTETGHGARDVTRQIGHGTWDIVREVGEGTRDGTKAVAEAVKKTVKPAPVPSEY